MRRRRWRVMTQSRQVIDPQRARGGDIVLRRRWERGVFITGLLGAIVLGLVFVVLTYWR